jgi:Predicted dithiol-disulfide isomerase involved in polyketide biosynthesis
MKVEIWSDIACPWCYIGKRRFEKALAQFPHKDQVTVTWRSFQLDPQAPQRSDTPLKEALAKKFGMNTAQIEQWTRQMAETAAGEGLDFRFDTIKGANTFDAHCLIHFAAHYGKQEEMKERLMHAYWTDGLPLWDKETLVKLAGEIGLDTTAARTALDEQTYASAVRADMQQAEDYGITGVPFFVIDEKYGISGAQPAETFKAALKQAWTEAHPLVKLGANTKGQAGTCEGDACAF